MINKATLIGRLSADPEIASLSNGTKVANFSIATPYRDKDGIKQPQWHKICVYNDSLVNNFIEPRIKKGDLVYVEGEIRTRKYNHAGTEMYGTWIAVKEIFKLLNPSRSDYVDGSKGENIDGNNYGNFDNCYNEGDL